MYKIADFTEIPKILFDTLRSLSKNDTTDGLFVVTPEMVRRVLGVGYEGFLSHRALKLRINIELGGRF